MKIQQFKNSPGAGSGQKSSQGCSQLTVLRNKIRYKLFPRPEPSVQSKVHTKTEATGWATASERTRVQKWVFFKSLQNRPGEIQKSNLNNTKLNLSVEIYRIWYSVEARVTPPPHAIPGDEARVYIKCYCWRSLSQRPGAGMNGAVTQTLGDGVMARGWVYAGIVLRGLMSPIH